VRGPAPLWARWPAVGGAGLGLPPSVGGVSGCLGGNKYYNMTSQTLLDETRIGQSDLSSLKNEKRERQAPHKELLCFLVLLSKELNSKSAKSQISEETTHTVHCQRQRQRPTTHNTTNQHASNTRTRRMDRSRSPEYARH
jgi:hypothetical protein